MKKTVLLFFVFLCCFKANAGCAFDGYYLSYSFAKSDTLLYRTGIFRPTSPSSTVEEKKELILDTIEVAESDTVILNLEIRWRYFSGTNPEYDSTLIRLVKDSLYEYLSDCDGYVEYLTYNIVKQSEYQKIKLYPIYGNTVVIHFKPPTPVIFTLNINNSLVKFNTEEQQFNLKIINLSGYKVHEQSIENAEKVVLDGDIPSGIYILVLSNGKSNYTKKIFL